MRFLLADSKNQQQQKVLKLMELAGESEEKKKMGSRRIVFQNWIVDLGRDPAEPWCPSSGSQDDLERSKEIRKAVVEALNCLSSEERQVVENHHFDGLTFREISEESGRAMHSLVALHRRALRRLRRKLEPFAKRLYGVSYEQDISCPICDSEFCAEIDEFIAAKDVRETWAGIMRILRQKYNIKIRTPQTLIGHEKYH